MDEKDKEAKVKSFYCCVHLAFIALVLIASGCASTGKITAIKTAGLVEPDRYKILTIHVYSEDKKASSQVSALESQLRQDLRNRGRFETVYFSDEKQEKSADLKLDVKLLKVRRVSSLSRVMFGAFAGRAKLVAQVQIADLNTQAEVASFEVEGKSSGGTVFAGTTDQAVQQVSKQIVDYLTSGKTPETGSAPNPPVAAPPAPLVTEPQTPLEAKLPPVPLVVPVPTPSGSTCDRDDQALLKLYKIERCEVAALTKRCGPGDACMIDCYLSRKGDVTPGGCYAVCGTSKIGWTIPSDWSGCR